MSTDSALNNEYMNKEETHLLAVCSDLLSLFIFPSVPSDVFFINSLWKGFYEHLGKRQPATLTVDWFNATSSKVNATFLEASSMQLKLSGKARN